MELLCILNAPDKHSWSIPLPALNTADDMNRCSTNISVGRIHGSGVVLTRKNWRVSGCSSVGPRDAPTWASYAQALLVYQPPYLLLPGEGIIRYSQGHHRGWVGGLSHPLGLGIEIHLDKFGFIVGQESFLKVDKFMFYSGLLNKISYSILDIHIYTHISCTV